MIRTVVAIESRNLSDAVCLALERDGIPVRFRCQTGAEALRALKKMGGGVAVCSFRLPDMTANDLRDCAGGSASVLVVAKPQYLELCRGEDIFKLAVPVRKSELTGTVGMLLRLDGERGSARHRRSPEDEQTIETAKRLLMERNGMTEQEAHRYLQKTSMERCRTMADTAGLVVAAFENENV